MHRPESPAFPPPSRSRARLRLAVVGLILALMLGMVGRAVDAGPGNPFPEGTRSAVPGATPGTPVVQQEIEPGVTDIVVGLAAMPDARLGLPAARTRSLRGALSSQLRNVQEMEATERLFRHVLTTAQLKLVEKAQRGGALKVTLGPARPGRPGADPLVDRVIEILEKKSAGR